MFNVRSFLNLMKLPLIPLLLMACVSTLAQEEVIVPSERAARETLRLSAEESSLRLGGLDIFPHVAGEVRYDDNLLISHTNQLADEIWAFTPGLTIAAGDVAKYLPGSVTLEQLRSLMYYSLVDDVSKPGRFLALDYTPSFSFYTHSSTYNNISQSFKFSGAYSLTRLALGLDFDFTGEYIKDSGVGDLLQIYRYDGYLRSRYDISDRTSLEFNGIYRRFDYANQLYQGYSDIKNEDWLNRQFADRLNLGVGLGFGLVLPEASANQTNNSPNQTYEQVLTRGIYRLTDKLYFSTALGVEFRQYGSGESGALHPVFSLSSIYQVREGTTLTLEGHRRDAPAPYGGYNTTIVGGGVSARQLLFGRLYATASLGFDNLQYRGTGAGFIYLRSDNYLNGRLQFDYEFNRHVTGSLFYTYNRDDSSYDFYSYDNNVVGLRLTWRL